MGWLQQWSAKQRGKKSMLGIGILSATIFVAIGYKQFYKPWDARRRLIEAEEYADFLLKTEK